MKVFICVRKITFDEITTVFKPVDISVGTLPRLLTQSFPTTKNNPSLLTCKGIWTCHPVPGLDDKLLVSLVRKNKSLASVVIPFAWLPQDQVVETWFPLKLQNHKTWKHAPMALISIHFDTLGKKRFDAPRGSLNVTPNWKMPQIKKQQKPKKQLVYNNPPQMIYPQQQIPIYYNYPQYPVQYTQNGQFINYQIPINYPQPQYQQHIQIQQQQPIQIQQQQPTQIQQSQFHPSQPQFEPLKQQQQVQKQPQQFQQPQFQPPQQIQKQQQFQRPVLLPQYPILSDGDIPNVSYPAFH